MIWHYQGEDGEQYSFEEEKFFQMVSGNLVSSETWVFTEGMNDWLPASEARPEFFGGKAEDAPPDVPRTAAPATPAAPPGPPPLKPKGPAPAAAQAAAPPPPTAIAQETEENSKPPVWAVAPAVVCGAMPVVCGFGAITGGIAGGGIGGVLAVSRMKGWSGAARVWGTVGVCLLIWAIGFGFAYKVHGVGKEFVASLFGGGEEKKEEKKREPRKKAPRNQTRDQDPIVRVNPKTEELIDPEFFGVPVPADPAPAPVREPEPEPEPDEPKRSRDVPEGLAATDFVGGQGGSPFYDFHTGGLPMIGVEWRFKTWSDLQVPCNLRSLYSRDEKPEQEDLLHLFAEDGFAVGGMEIEGGEHVYAIRLIFMAIGPDGRLDPGDTYKSKWIGQARPEPEFTQFVGKGQPVRGLAGQGGMVTDAIGLLFAETDLAQIKRTDTKPTMIASTPGTQPKPQPPNSIPTPRPKPTPTPDPGSQPIGEINDLAAAGRALRGTLDEDVIKKAATFIIEKAPPADRTRLAGPLSQVLQPHLGNENPEVRAKVTLAFAFVATREQSQYLQQLASLELGKWKDTVGAAMAGLCRVDSFRARSIYEEKWEDQQFIEVVNRALLEAKQEDWIIPLLDIKNEAIFEKVCRMLGTVGTARSASAMERAASGLWPSGTNLQGVKNIAQNVASQIRERTGASSGL